MPSSPLQTLCIGRCNCSTQRRNYKDCRQRIPPNREYMFRNRSSSSNRCTFHRHWDRSYPRHPARLQSRFGKIGGSIRFLRYGSPVTPEGIRRGGTVTSCLRWNVRRQTLRLWETPRHSVDSKWAQVWGSRKATEFEVRLISHLFTNCLVSMLDDQYRATLSFVVVMISLPKVPSISRAGGNVGFERYLFPSKERIASYPG